MATNNIVFNGSNLFEPSLALIQNTIFSPLFTEYALYDLYSTFSPNLFGFVGSPTRQKLIFSFLFFNYSSSFSNHTVFSPYRLYLTERYNDDEIQFHNDLKKKGYHVKKPHENIFKTAKKNFMEDELIRICKRKYI